MTQPNPPLPGPYPVTVEFDANAQPKRWSPLVNWFLAIPHFIVLYVLQIVAFFCFIISFFTILFTKQIPDGVFNFAVMTQRYQWRVYSYVMFLRSTYPPFEFPTVGADPGDDAARLSIDRPAEYRRFMPLIKWLLAIPHLIVLCVLGIGAMFVLIIGFFVVLFTARWPEGLRDYLVGVMRWQNRVMAYVMLLVDDYPPFSLE